MAPGSRAGRDRGAGAVPGRPGAGTALTPPAIEARGWGWRYPGRRAWALRGLDLRIEHGERILLLGPSGSGKSTLLAGLAGLLDQSGGGDAAGELLVDGEDPRATRERVGLVFQDPESQLIMARAGDDVAFGLENRCVPTEAIWPRVDAAFDAVGFAHGRDRRTAALSGGEKQRLAIAGVMALQPSLLLLDEPTANLDPEGAAAIRELIGRLRTAERTTMLLVEHRVDEAVALADRVVVLEPGGGVTADGPPAEVFGRHGEQLAAAGVWVPGVPLPSAPRAPRSSAAPLVAAREASFRYPGATAEAVRRASVEVLAGEAVGLVGPNGSGKSSLILMLAGLLRPTGGEVVAGAAVPLPQLPELPELPASLARWPARHLVRLIGTVFQEPEHQFLAGSVDAELMLGPLRAGIGRAEVERRSRELLERLHLTHLAAANPFTLSGGEKRRLSVATALATAPPVVILDEPTYGQDRRTWVEMLELLASVRRSGSAVCFASHDQRFVDALADRIVPIDAGRALAAVAV